MSENKLNIVVSNRSRSEAFRPDTSEQWAAISIFTPDNEPAKLVGFKKVLHLCFDDVCSMDPTLSRFTPQMAEKAWAFVDDIIGLGISNLLVHCDAGRSRSPGMAIAIDEMINKVTDRAAKHPTYNSLVYSTMIHKRQDPGYFPFIKDNL